MSDALRSAVPSEYALAVAKALVVSAAVALAFWATGGGSGAVVVVVAFAISLAAGLLVAQRAIGALRAVSRAAENVAPDTLGEPIELDGAVGEVAELQAALNDALRRLDDAFRTQRQFIANVSHELKTPIAVLMTEAQVLASAADDAAALDAFRRDVLQELRRLSGMVESFLVLARARHDDGLSRLETVHLTEVMLDCVRGSAALATERAVRIVPHVELDADEASPKVRGDTDLLRSMLGNLVRNAIQHSPHGGVVDVRLLCAETAATFAVRDRGPGLPEGGGERLFERFVRGADDAEDRRGFGVGLSIAYHVATLHGGTISAENADGGGSEFRVELPLGRSAPA